MVATLSEEWQLAMNDRVYILLDIVDGKAEQAVKVLRKSLGVIMVDALESPPDVIMVMEAPERQQLAKQTTQALASLETITEHVCLLPAREKINTAISSKLSRWRKDSDKTGSSKRLLSPQQANQISQRKGE